MILKKRVFIKSLRVIIILLAVCFINDVFSLYLFYQQKSNFLFYNVFLLIETLSLYYFFSNIINNHVFQKMLLFLGIIFSIFWFFSLLKFGNKSYFYGCINFENISILPLAIFYYYEQIILINATFIYAESIFWIVTAYFIYFCGTFFLYLFIPSLNILEQKDYYDILNSIFIIIRTVLLSVAIFIKPGYSKINSSNLV